MQPAPDSEVTAQEADVEVDASRSKTMRVFEVETSLGVVPEPASLHEATAYLCLSNRKYATGSKILALRICFLAASFVLVFIQTASAAALLRNIDNFGRECNQNDDCRYGFYCSYVLGNCAGCNLVKDPVGTDGYDDDYCNSTSGSGAWLARVEFVGGPMVGRFSSTKENAEYCDACYLSNREEYIRSPDGPAKNVSRMLWYDWIMMTLATAVIASAFMDEMHDIKNAQFRVRDETGGGGSAGAGVGFLAFRFDGHLPFRLFLFLLTSIRQFVFLPILLGVVPMFILRIDSDALNICMNTVAVLFLLELDNLAFEHGLSRGMRAFFQAAPPLGLQKSDDLQLNISNYLTAAASFAAVFSPLVVFTNDVRGSRGDYPTFLTNYVAYFPIFGGHIIEVATMTANDLLVGYCTSRGMIVSQLLTALLVICCNLAIGVWTIFYIYHTFFGDALTDGALEAWGIQTSSVDAQLNSTSMLKPVDAQGPPPVA